MVKSCCDSYHTQFSDFSTMLSYHEQVRIPLCVVILPLIAGVLGGIPFVLFTLKEQKFGAVTLMGMITGFLTFLVGQTWMSILFGLVFGFLGDLIMKSGNYKSWKKNGQKAGDGVLFI